MRQAVVAVQLVLQGAQLPPQLRLLLLAVPLLLLLLLAVTLLQRAQLPPQLRLFLLAVTLLLLLLLWLKLPCCMRSIRQPFMSLVSLRLTTVAVRMT